MKINIKNPKGIVPGFVMQQPSFQFAPRDFAVGDDRQESRVIPGRVQEQSLERWQEDSTVPILYGVGSDPDDRLALYFAGYLAMLHAKQVRNCRIEWHSLYGGFKNPLLDKEGLPPTLLILHNLTPDSTNSKIEKARDLLEHFRNIPRIVVTAGVDPMTFFVNRLYLPLNSLFYAHSHTVKQKITVI